MGGLEMTISGGVGLTSNIHRPRISSQMALGQQRGATCTSPSTFSSSSKRKGAKTYSTK